jgi:hypothetical protein
MRAKAGIASLEAMLADIKSGKFLTVLAIPSKTAIAKPLFGVGSKNQIYASR